MAKKGGKDLRVVGGKIKPAFNEEDLIPKPDEEDEGDIGKGPLCRRYVDNLTMEFYAGASRERSADGRAEAMTVKLPSTLMMDLAIMVESSKTPFRTKSEFVRTAIFILMNYYGRKYHTLKKRFDIFDAIKMSKRHQEMGKMVESFLKEFSKTMDEMESELDVDVDQYIKKQVAVLDSMGGKRADELRREIRNILLNHRINPIPYLGEESDDASD